MEHRRDLRISIVDGAVGLSMRVHEAYGFGFSRPAIGCRGHGRRMKINCLLEFGQGWSKVGSTYPCIGNSRMRLARAPNVSGAMPD